MIDKDLTKQLKLAAKKAGQIHLFRFWNELSGNSQHKLIRQIQSIDFELMNKLKKEYLLTNDKKHLLGEFEPIPILPLPKTSQQQAAAAAAKKSGEKLLAEGKVAALLVAGGQGSRLDFAGPKGKFPAGPISGKSLFQMHAEKILALNKKYRTNIPWFIMTSEIKIGRAHV